VKRTTGHQTDSELQTEISIREIVTSINGIAQSIISVFDEVKEAHSEAYTFWSLFNDSDQDDLEMLRLDSMMLQISNISLEFSKNHLRTVHQLWELDALLARNNLDSRIQKTILCEANSVPVAYSGQQLKMVQLRNSFMRSASYFLFPSQKAT